MTGHVDILAFGAHPDDVEFCCGGILARARAEKLHIAIADLTLGELGTSGSPEIRRDEALKAAALIGAKRCFLNFADCAVTDHLEARMELVKVIRTFRPHLVLAPLWRGERAHPDHLACGQLARFACRLARFGSLLPGLPAHTVGNILHYHFPWQENPTFLVDITDHVPLWDEMMRAHQSQMQTRPYRDWSLKGAAALGIQLGVAYAQGLTQGSPLDIADLKVLFRGTSEL